MVDLLFRALGLVLGICSTPITVIKGRNVSMVTLVASFDIMDDNCLLRLGGEGACPARCGDGEEDEE